MVTKPFEEITFDDRRTKRTGTVTSKMELSYEIDGAWRKGRVVAIIRIIYTVRNIVYIVPVEARLEAIVLEATPVSKRIASIRFDSMADGYVQRCAHKRRGRRENLPVARWQAAPARFSDHWRGKRQSHFLRARVNRVADLLVRNPTRDRLPDRVYALRADRKKVS